MPLPTPATSLPQAERVAALRRLFPALADGAPATLARIAEKGMHRKVSSGTVLFDAHTPCAGFPLVLAGAVKVLQRYPNGREMPLYRVRPGESCLLSGSCLLGHTELRDGSIMALLPTRRRSFHFPGGTSRPTGAAVLPVPFNPSESLVSMCVVCNNV
jgi:hypothetical protein